MNKVYLKKDIVRYLAQKSEYSQAVCEDVLNAYHSLLEEAVANCDRVQDFGYIDISANYVPEHRKTDPRDNNIEVVVKPKYKVRVNIGKTLKNASQKALKYNQ